MLFRLTVHRVAVKWRMASKKLAAKKRAALRRAIEAKGGQAALGRSIGKAQQTVYDWLHRLGHVPGESVPAVAKATGIPECELRPDLYRAPFVEPSSKPEAA